MKIAQLRSTDISNGTGIGISIWTQGCPYRCKGCHNASTWSFDGGKDFDQQHKDNFLNLLNNTYITRVSILGGEPLLPQNVADLALLIHDIKKKREDVQIWLWTGTTLEALYDIAFYHKQSNDDILNSLNWTSNNLRDLVYILNNVDNLIDGRFEQDKKDLTLKYRGSSNQRWIDLKESVRNGKNIVVHDEKSD